jgi:cation transport regulator ChaC
MPEDNWIFGYGSLIWRPAFPFEERRPAFIRGWTRRFWQESTDHRGTVEQPGRVVTLLARPQTICWGAAYRVHSNHLEGVLEALDAREQQGYERRRTKLHIREYNDELRVVEDVHLYVATQENPHFRDAESEEEIAEVVRVSHGPSGANVDYVLQLADALESMGVEDHHVSRLAGLLREPC